MFSKTGLSKSLGTVEIVKQGQKPVEKPTETKVEQKPTETKQDSSDDT